MDYTDIGPRSRKMLTKFRRRKQELETELQEAIENHQKVQNQVTSKKSERETLLVDINAVCKR